MKRLHKQVFWSLGEDVPASFHYAVTRKKRLRLLSEERLRRVKRRLACPAIASGDGGHLCSPFFLPFKNGGWIFIFPRHSEWLFEVKNSEFRCEMNF